MLLAVLVLAFEQHIKLAFLRRPGATPQHFPRAFRLIIGFWCADQTVPTTVALKRFRY